MFKTIKEDIRTVFEKDPAARKIIEVLLCYPGLHALWFHRIAHFFYRRKEYIIARLISHISRWITGVEIHPGATIGRKFFIDHGMGVVIGETTEIGNNCLLYQGVVLGGTSLEKKKRHPTLGDNVVVGAGATLLGAIKVGDSARIGAGSVVLTDVPPKATVVGIPGRIGLGFSGKEIQALEHSKLPDPVADAIRLVLKEQDLLEKRLSKVENLEGITSEIDKYVEKKKKEIEKEFTEEREKRKNET
ncbi:MAG: serine O-acetyltransferase [Elusimicrobiota bacterium]|nr:serine O-acetyltransferase [Elusimicrobiota bacterium]MDH5661616.1 serine O-acetyltransferase [Elusimicrobiota bacterium]